jgi:hypothetical protein
MSNVILALANDNSLRILTRFQQIWNNVLEGDDMLM